MDSTETVETRAKAEGSEPLSSKFWLNEIDAAKKRDEKWWKRANKVVARYRDERELEQRAERRTNILWSNTDVLKAVLFQSLGNPDVRRRFPKKGKDDRAARQSSLVLERSLSACNDLYDAEGPVEAAVEDMLLPGRGQCWVVYDADVGEEEGEDGESVPTEIIDQKVYYEHIFWQDYLTSAGRKEADIWWKARGHDYTRDELKKYFPEHGDKIPLNTRCVDAPSDVKGDEDTFKRARVWEIWDKSKKERVWVAEDYKVVLKNDPDPYKLAGFFPCPAAMYGVKTTSSLVPIPEYTLYQDQAEELDQITTRLNRLIDALKRRGVYDAGSEGAENQLSGLATADDNTFLPFRGWSQLLEKGGLKGVFQTEDLKPISEVVAGLYNQRQMLVQTIYEVTGISDVIRGSSNPNETATAQRLKGQFGSLRIQKRQKIVQTFIRDLTRIKAEIIAEHFTREKLEEMSGIEMPLQMEIEQAKQQLGAFQQQQQMAQQQQSQAAQQGGQMPMNGMQPQPKPEQIAELTSIAKAVPWEDIGRILRSDQLRGYKVDIETENTAQADEQADKESRIEFLTTMQGFLERLLPAMKMEPQIAPLAKELVNFALRGFKVGRQLEETFNDAFEQMASAPPQQPQPDPVAEAKAKKIESDIELSKQKAGADIQITQQKMQSDQVKQRFDVMGKQMDFALKKEEAQSDQQMQREKFAMEREHMAEDRQMNRVQNAVNMREQNRRLEMDEDAARFDRRRAMMEEQRPL